MSSADHYTIRTTTGTAIKKGFLKIKLHKNDANQYSHNAVVLVGKQIRRLLTGIYNSGADGPGMSKLMDTGDNALTLRKNTDTHTIVVTTWPIPCQHSYATSPHTRPTSTCSRHRP